MSGRSLPYMWAGIFLRKNCLKTDDFWKNIA